MLYWILGLAALGGGAYVFMHHTPPALAPSAPGGGNVLSNIFGQVEKGIQTGESAVQGIGTDLSGITSTAGALANDFSGLGKLFAGGGSSGGFSDSGGFSGFSTSDSTSFGDTDYSSTDDFSDDVSNFDAGDELA